jgi:hypothetical protein
VRLQLGDRAGSVHQLEPIAEGVEDVDAAKAVEGCVRFGREALALARGNDVVESIHNKSGMRAFRRMEVRFDAKVQIHTARNEPDTFPFRHFGWLLDFRETEDAGIKLASACFTTDWDGDLDVVEFKDGHCFTIFESSKPNLVTYGR